ncbi:MAG TPA: cysteine desulfurase-like protein [Blastocatellia bacterium]|nr:cysteine desulfurase-like protein [Blastocatellia bacterium]
MTAAVNHSSVASVEEIRSHFPALERQHNGFPVAYFDGPGGTQVPRSVAEAMNDYLFNHNANTHWEYPSSYETDEIIARSRETLADFLNASADEIAFGQNMTSLTFHLGRALGRQFKPGDEIIVTELDHHANSDTWRSLVPERGVVIRTVPLDIESGTIDLSDLANLLNERTRLVAIGAASNALGTITDVKRAAQMAREAGALSFVDAVHYAPHVLTDVQEIGCDFLACSAYKFYGPHIGLLYGRKGLLEAIDFPKLEPAPDNAPDRVETGTQSHESIAGAAAAVDFLASFSDGATRRERLVSSFRALHARGSELLRRIWEGLSAIDGVRIYGPPPEAPRTPTVSFTLKGRTSSELARALAARGVFASNGDFYALTVARRMGVAEEGFLRAGCACYTTAEEVDRLVAVVREL